MSNQKNIVTTIRGIGVVEADYDVVKISGSIEIIEDTKEKVSSKLFSIVEKVKSKLSNLNEKGFKTGDSFKSTQSINQNKMWDDKKRTHFNKGYVGTYQFSLMSENLHLVSDVYHELMLIDLLELDPPKFLFKDLDNLHESALKDAHNKVMDRLTKECRVLGVSKETLQVHSWTARYDESSLAKRTPIEGSVGVTRSAELFSPANADTNDVINLEPGKGQVNVYLDTSFSYKDK